MMLCSTRRFTIQDHQKLNARARQRRKLQRRKQRVTQRSSEGCKGERVFQKHQQQDNDAHDVGETKEIETYKAASKKSEATEKYEI